MIIIILLKKIQRFLLRTRLRPIHVYCFHQVGDVYDPTKSFECDWIEIKQFKHILDTLSRRFTFISLSEAYSHLSKDRIRLKNYAVLTCDDGYKSVLNVLPFIKEKGIPITLFVNANYLDGTHYIPELYYQAVSFSPNIEEQEFVNSLYLSLDELENMDPKWVSIGNHGWEHNVVSKLSPRDFEKQLDDSTSIIKRLSSFTPFYAYTYGRHSTVTDMILHDSGYIPVLMDGMVNINETKCIHRELLRI